jgi:hypothetical protein
MLRDAPEAEKPQDDKPDQHHRAEQPANRSGAAALDQEQAGEQNERDRNDIGLAERGRDLQPFDSA